MGGGAQERLAKSGTIVRTDWGRNDSARLPLHNGDTHACRSNSCLDSFAVRSPGRSDVLLPTSGWSERTGALPVLARASGRERAPIGRLNRWMTALRPAQAITRSFGTCAQEDAP